MGNYLIKIARWTQPDFLGLARRSKRAQLITVSYSHFAEFARWSLQLRQIAFDEHKYAPLQHVLPVLAARFPSASMSRHLSTTSKMKTWSSNGNPKQSNGATSIPLCILPDGTVLRDSWEIASFAGLEPPSPELKLILDEDLGPLARQYIYSYVLKPSNVNIWDALVTTNKGMLWRLFWWVYGKRMLTQTMHKMLRPMDALVVNNCKDKLRETVEKLGVLLQNSNGKYIQGERLTAADIAIASLASVLVFPPALCNGEFSGIFSQLQSQDSELAQDVMYWRQTRIGEFVLFMYSEHRKSAPFFP